MNHILFYPNANTMHQEKVISLEFLPDGRHVKLKTEVMFPQCCQGDIRSYPEYPINDLSIVIK